MDIDSQSCKFPSFVSLALFHRKSQAMLLRLLYYCGAMLSSECISRLSFM